MNATINEVSSTLPGTDESDRCPECGQQINGIAADGPGIHKFVGCGHAASGRSVRATGPSLVGLAVE